MGITVSMPYETYNTIKSTLQDLMSSLITLTEAMEDSHNEQRPETCKDKLHTNTINSCFGDPVKITRDNIADLYAQIITQERTPHDLHRE